MPLPMTPSAHARPDRQNTHSGRFSPSTRRRRRREAERGRPRPTCARLARRTRAQVTGCQTPNSASGAAPRDSRAAARCQCSSCAAMRRDSGSKRLIAASATSCGCRQRRSRRHAAVAACRDRILHVGIVQQLPVGAVEHDAADLHGYSRHARRASATRAFCSTSRIATPCSRLMRRDDARRCPHVSSGERPSEGSSSRISVRLRHQRAADREHLLLAAREQCRRCWSRRSRRRGKQREDAARRSAAPSPRRRARANAPIVQILRARVRNGNTWRPSGTSAMPRRATSSGSRAVDGGAVEVDAARCADRPRRRSVFSRVVLPAPLAPSTATMLPVATSKLTPRSAGIGPYQVSTLRTSSRGGHGSGAEIGGDDGRIALHFGRRAARERSALVHHQHAVARPRRPAPCRARP